MEYCFECGIIDVFLDVPYSEGIFLLIFLESSFNDILRVLKFPRMAKMLKLIRIIKFLKYFRKMRFAQKIAEKINQTCFISALKKEAKITLFPDYLVMKHHFSD